MSDYVDLRIKRLRGWPWPKDCLGLDPMYGPDGWCRACGTPMHEQTGALILERSRVALSGAWTPNWRYDTICVDLELGAQVQREFDVNLREVEWASGAEPNPLQIVVPTLTEPWFEAAQLSERAAAAHGSAGATCSECKRWRWMPLDFADGLLLNANLALAGDIVASPERFGDGRKSYRLVLARRELAELLSRSSPRDFAIREVARSR